MWHYEVTNVGDLITVIFRYKRTYMYAQDRRNKNQEGKTTADNQSGTEILLALTDLE